MLSCTSLKASRMRRRSGAWSRHAPSTSLSSASSTSPSHFLGACAGAADAADIAAAPAPRVVGRLRWTDGFGSVSRSAAGRGGEWEARDRRPTYREKTGAVRRGGGGSAGRKTFTKARGFDAIYCAFFFPSFFQKRKCPVRAQHPYPFFLLPVRCFFTSRKREAQLSQK